MDLIIYNMKKAIFIFLNILFLSASIYAIQPIYTNDTNEILPYAEEISQAEKSVEKAENSKVNSGVGFSAGLGLSYGSTYLLDNPTLGWDKVNNYINLGSSFEFEIKPHYSSYLKLRVGINSPINTPEEESLVGGLGRFQLEYSMSGMDSKTSIWLGGPYYNQGSSVLTAGEIISGWGAMYFERRDWYKVTLPEVHYKELYAGSRMTVSDEDEDNFTGIKGLFLKHYYIPFQLSFKGFYGRTYDIEFQGETWPNNYQSGTWFRYGSLNKKINKQVAGVNYAGHVINRFKSELNDEEAHLFSFTLNGEYADFSYNLESAFSSARRPNENNEKASGQSALMSISKKLAQFLFINNLDSNLRLYYASPRYYGKFNTVQNTLPLFLSDPAYPVMGAESFGHFYANSYAAYWANRFNILKGITVLTWGFSQEFEKTQNIIKLPHHINHYTWYSMVDSLNDAGYTNVAVDWGTDHSGASESYQEITIYNGEINYLSSIKTYPLLKLDMSYNVSDWIDLGIPVYYMNKLMWNAVCDKAAYIPFVNKWDKISGMTLYEHFFAFGVHPEFYIIAFYATETLFLNSTLINYTFFDMRDDGYGIGFDYYPTGQGIGFFFRLRYFEHYDNSILRDEHGKIVKDQFDKPIKYREEFNFSGITAYLSTVWQI